MIFLRTGLPGASKTLNSVADLVTTNEGTRPIFYTNIRLLMLDYDIASGFSGWFYGHYINALKDKNALRRLKKIIAKVHQDDEFVSLSDVPWLESYFEARNPLDTWLFWVRKLYSKKQLEPIEAFISNFPKDQLTFEHLKQFNLHFTRFDNAREWYLLPKTSIILIDECQQFFPPRSTGSTVPIHCSEFETHRHKGFDIHLITQDRMLLDVNIRKLTNRHIHYHNAFGGDRVTKYSGSKVFDQSNYFDLQSVDKSIFKRPVNFYGSYFSAEMHTHKFKIPKFVYFFVGILILLVLVSIFLYKTFTGIVGEEKSPSQIAENASIEFMGVGGQSKANLSIPPVTTVESTVADPQKDFLVKYISKIITDVYIDGSVSIYKDGAGFQYQYSFSNSSGDIFDPHSVGLKVKPISACLVELSIYDYRTYLTCNPLRKIIIVDEEKELYASSPRG